MGRETVLPVTMRQRGFVMASYMVHHRYSVTGRWQAPIEAVDDVITARLCYR